LVFEQAGGLCGRTFGMSWPEWPGAQHLTLMFMKPIVKTILFTGLFVGVTDIAAATISAWIRSGNFPSRIFHYIAGGALGLERSMAGDWKVAVLGCFFHFFIAMSWTVFFFVVFPRLKFLWFNKYVVGFLYGPFVGAIMNFIVLPLTPLPQSPFSLIGSIIGWSILGVVLGIPIAISAYRFYGVEGSRIRQTAG
jgi:hypothetical protein